MLTQQQGDMFFETAVLWHDQNWKLLMKESFFGKLSVAKKVRLISTKKKTAKIWGLQKSLEGFGSFLTKKIASNNKKFNIQITEANPEICR